MLEEGLLADPIAKILMGSHIIDSSRSYLVSSTGDQDKSENDSFKSDSLDPEVPRDIDLIVSQLNSEL